MIRFSKDPSELFQISDNAKSRIRELENKRFELQSDQHELMKKYNIVTKKLQKLKGEHAEERTIDNKIFKVFFRRVLWSTWSTKHVRKML